MVIMAMVSQLFIRQASWTDQLIGNLHLNVVGESFLSEVPGLPMLAKHQADPILKWRMRSHERNLKAGYLRIDYHIGRLLKDI